MIRSPLDLDRVERFEEPPLYGPTCDILWSDPMDEAQSDYAQKHAVKALVEEEYFVDNHTRGCGQLFGHQAT
jgi:diadenosine tetraphosphatase ApaH/serine/threonine PP2A family protein phosphatase